MAGKILIVDDVATNRFYLSQLLERAYYEVEEAADAEQALAMVRADRPDLILLDVMMPGMNGFELCRVLKADLDLCTIPVVIITALDSRADRREDLSAGADDFLTKPVQPLPLFARLRSLLRMKAMTEELRLRGETDRELGDGVDSPLLIEPQAGARVLGLTSVDEAAAMALMLQSGLDVTVETVTEVSALFQSIATAAPEAVVLDAMNIAGFSSDLVTALRQRPETRSAAMLTLIDADDFRLAANCLDAGANDYVMWPVDASEMAARLRTQLRYKAYADHLRQSVRDGLRLAATDPLTGLRNRRYVDVHLARMIESARRNRAPLALLAFDLDRFKAINDTHGHAAGDAILVEFARRLMENTRSVDLVARIGGEEFIAVLPDAGVAHAGAAAERVRAAIEAPGFVAGDKTLPVTVSVGVASLREGVDDARQLLARADAALYFAKANGRNRVSLEAA